MVNSEQVVFWLKRRIRELQAKQPSDTEMAKDGLSYGERRDVYEEADKAAEDGAGELAAMQAALEMVETLIEQHELKHSSTVRLWSRERGFYTATP